MARDAPAISILGLQTATKDFDMVIVVAQILSWGLACPTGACVKHVGLPVAMTVATSTAQPEVGNKH